MLRGISWWHPSFLPFCRHDNGVASHFCVTPLTLRVAPCREICLSAEFTGWERLTVQTHVSHPFPLPLSWGSQFPMHDYLHLITLSVTQTVCKPNFSVRKCHLWEQIARRCVCVGTVGCTCVCAGLGTCCGTDYNSQQQLNRVQSVRRRTRKLVGFRRFRRNMIYVSKSISTRVTPLSFHSWKWLRSVIHKPNRLSDSSKKGKRREPKYIRQTRKHHALMSTRNEGSSVCRAYVLRFYITDKVTLWNNHI